MVLPLSLVGFLLLSVQPVASQVGSPFWNSTITISTTERVRLAGTALDVAIDRLDADGLFDVEGYGISGNLYSQMAEFDIATNQTKYQNVLEQYFQLQEMMDANFSNPFTDYTLSFGHAAVKAYAAYNNEVFLRYAVESWWLGRRRTLSQFDVSAGKNAGKNFNITKVCQNATMVGGTFWDDDPTEPRIAGPGTGFFLVLSALLAEATSDPLYLQAANESATFIHSHLYNVRNIVQDYILTDANAQDSSGCEVQTSTDPSSSGLMIEGLAILASMTNSTSTRNLLNDLILAVIPNTAWQGDNGVVSVQGIMGGLTLLRGLNSAYTRHSTNTMLRQYVGDYIAVQFNAVTNLATVHDTNIYGGSWTGPPSANFSGVNQTLALAALISTIGLETASSSSPTTSSSPSPTPSPLVVHHKSHKLAAILGGTLGGLVILVLILTVLWTLRRQSSRTRRNSLNSSVVPEPFPSSLLTGSSHGQKHSDHLNSPSTNRGIAPKGEYSPPINSARLNTVTDHGNVENAPASDLPTDQLVQLLNQRLQNRRWDEGETPPDYSVAPST